MENTFDKNAPGFRRSRILYIIEAEIVFLVVIVYLNTVVKKTKSIHK